MSQHGRGDRQGDGSTKRSADDTADALRVSEARYRHIVEGARDYAIFTTDENGRISEWTAGAVAVYGWPADEAVGMPVQEIYTPEDRAAGVPEKEMRLARQEGVAPNVRWHVRKDGRRVFIDGVMRALTEGGRGPQAFLKIGQDVTERIALDEALRASEERYRALIENVRDYAIFRLDAQGVVTDWPVGAESVKGYAAEEVIGQHVSIFYTPEAILAGEPQAELAETAETGRAERESWRVRKGGERFWVNEIATAIRDGEGRLVGFTKISRDLTERLLADAIAEREREAALREGLRRQLAAAEEAERRRIARELHDRLGQELTAIRFGLDDAAAQIGALVPPDSPLHARLATLSELTDRMTAGARYIALELRPPELDDLGFESALATFVAEWSARYGVKAELETNAQQELDLPVEIGSALYRISQEALTNVARHAGAGEVGVILERVDGEVRLIVEDNGRGFDPEAFAERIRSDRRLGIAGMRERAALLGGTVNVESTLGVGTTLYARIPLSSSVDSRAPDAG